MCLTPAVCLEKPKRSAYTEDRQVPAERAIKQPMMHARHEAERRGKGAALGRLLLLKASDVHKFRVKIAAWIK